MIRITGPPSESECLLCGYRSRLLSDIIGVCVGCLRERGEEALRIVEGRHEEVRRSFGLPPRPPRDPNGIPCNLCECRCRIPEGGYGYCGIWRNVKGRLEPRPGHGKALLHHYLDAHVTNCCAAWFCPAATGQGYPKYAVCPGAEHGYYNLALFFYGCGFNCLFCQNWTHKVLEQAKAVSSEELVSLTLRDWRITCWCWFGGSPEPQLPFAVKTSRMVLEEKPEGRVLRICFEWNGAGNPAMIRKAAELAYVSGGNVKFDLKAYTPSVHKALTGQDNKLVLENFEMVYREFYEGRRDVPVLNATTLLVPHYVDAKEVGRIAEFIASLDPEIPYSLLVFHPDFMMSDTTVTPKKQVEECYQAAKKHLRRVNIGNVALLGLHEAGLI